MPEPLPMPATSATSVRPGDLLGDYRVLETLGSGGMGDVFLAEHTRFRDRVAVKVLRAEYVHDTRAHGRFVREARLARRVRHEHIAETAELEYLPDGRPYLMMEHVEGEDVYALWTDGGMSLERFLDVMTQIADALASAHRAGVVHRDLKPGNIYLAERNERLDHVKILDFGLAKLIHAGDEKLTQTGQVVATPSYMSPEQATGDPVDGRSDIYSLGVMMWELLVGRRPFHGSSFGDFVLLHATQQPLPPSRAGERRLDRAIPPELEAVVLRCLAKRPQDRFASAEELLRALGGVQQPRQRAFPRLSRRARLLVAAASVTAVMIGWMVHALFTTPPAAPPPVLVTLPAPVVTPFVPPAAAPLVEPPTIPEPMTITEPVTIELPSSGSPRALAPVTRTKRRPIVRGAHDAQDDGVPGTSVLKDPFAGRP